MKRVGALVVLLLSCLQNHAAITARIQLLNLQSVSLSDFDLTKPQNAPIIFFVYVDNDSKHTQANVSIWFSSSTRGLIGKLTMNNASLIPNTRNTFTNRNFTDVDLNVNAPVGDQFLNAVKASGTFPADDYQYVLKIDSGGTTIATDQSSSTVSNVKNNPELIMPGAAFNQDVQKVYTPFPLFQWFGQTDKFDFALYEVRPDQHTPEDVVRNTPVFKQTDLTGNQFLYPAYAEKLVNGKTYAWQISGKVQAASGIQYLLSQVYRFSYADPGGGTTSSGSGGITPNVVTKIVINPQDISVPAGQQVQFYATFYDQANNQLLNVDRVQWQISPDKGTITQQGIFTAGNSAATVAVIVKAGAANEFATVTINPAPITVKGASGNWMAGDMIKQLFGLH